VELAALSRLAGRQHGVVTHAQAEALGCSDKQWRGLLGRGVLVPEGRGVAALAGAPSTSLRTIVAAVLGAGPSALASHTTGAHVWGAPVDGANPVHLLVGLTRSVRRSGVVLHRTTDALDLRPVLWHGIRVTNPLRVLCDVGAVDPEAVTPTLQHFFITGRVLPDAARNALERHSRKGRNGLGALRAALDDYPLGNKPPDSVLEATFGRLARDHRLPAMTFHARVEGWEVDFLVDDTPVVVETDGWSTHGLDREQFERDRRKDADLRAAGYIVCRYTWTQVTRQPRWVADTLWEVIRRWAPDRF
jgi:very-short-patch-repair endonuclease